MKEGSGISGIYFALIPKPYALLDEMNAPPHLLCNQMGHGNIHVTQLYYLAVFKSGIEILPSCL